MADIMDNVIEDIVVGKLEIKINQSKPINHNFASATIKNSESGTTRLPTAEERLKKQEFILKKIPLTCGSGIIQSKSTLTHWLF